MTAQGPTLSQPKAQDTVPILTYNYNMLVLFQQHCQRESSGSSNLTDVGLGACIFSDWVRWNIWWFILCKG